MSTLFFVFVRMKVVYLYVEKYKRFVIIGDIHLGVRGGREDWLVIHNDYFENFLFPVLETNIRPGDVILLAGDFFDNRHSINSRELNYGMEILSRLSQIAPVWVILGNHDVYYKHRNTVNSMNVFRHMPNVHIVEDYDRIQVGKKTLFLMSWQHGKDVEKLKESAGADYLLSHSEVYGFRVNTAGSIYPEGISAGVFSKFQHAYSGHCHWRQSEGNFTYVGNIFEFNRNDCGNSKGIYIVDGDSGQETFIENKISPRFIQMNYNQFISNPRELNSEIFRNNFVDIIVSQESFQLLGQDTNVASEYEGVRSINFLTIRNQQVAVSTDDNQELVLLDTMTMVENHIDKNEGKLGERTTKVKNIIRDAYQQAIKISDEE